MASRYNSYESKSSTSSHFPDPSKPSTLNRLIIGSASATRRNPPAELAKPSSSDLVKMPNSKNGQNLGAMVKKFMEKKSSSSKAKSGTGLVIAADILADDMKKTAKKGSNFTALHRKLFSKGASSDLGSGGKSEVKALAEVKSNTRSLAMVLRSERELLSQNKEMESEVAELKHMLDKKNNEVEKLKDLCLRQREEIKSLKSVILFPDVMNSQLQELFEKQGSELRQTKQVIPTLQRQVTSLAGQLQCLAEDLAEVKTGKNSAHASFESHVRSPMTPTYGEDANDSWEFSSEDPTTPGSPNDMFLKDLNPLLTPYAKSKSKDFQTMGYESRHDERSSKENVQRSHDFAFDTNVRKLSRSSEYHLNSSTGKTTTHLNSSTGKATTHLNLSTGKTTTRVSHRSDENKSKYVNRIQHLPF